MKSDSFRWSLESFNPISWISKGNAYVGHVSGWIMYNDLTVTSLEWWFLRRIIPNWHQWILWNQPQSLFSNGTSLALPGTAGILPVPDRDDRLVASTNTVMCLDDFSGTDVLSEMDGRKMVALWIQQTIFEGNSTWIWMDMTQSDHIGCLEIVRIELDIIERPYKRPARATHLGYPWLIKVGPHPQQQWATMYIYIYKLVVSYLVGLLVWSREGPYTCFFLFLCAAYRV